MLDGITLYWLTDSAGSSAQFYWESARNEPGGGFHGGRIELPMAATIFPRDYYRAPGPGPKRCGPISSTGTRSTAAVTSPRGSSLLYSPTRCAGRSARSAPHRQSKGSMTAEAVRLEEARTGKIPWKKWGPYLSERQWGTVREDYSQDGNAWDYFSHDQARSRAYHWGEDGLAGISDEKQLLCFSVALWNGKDPIQRTSVRSDQQPG